MLSGAALSDGSVVSVTFLIPTGQCIGNPVRLGSWSQMYKFDAVLLDMQASMHGEAVRGEQNTLTRASCSGQLQHGNQQACIRQFAA